MNREFKFRHANEIAGVFVIGAAVLFVLGIVFAGRSQGWFEPRFSLNVVFETTEGSFGLQEGAPVLVRNTQAGRVGPVLPTADGKMGTTLVLKDRFRSFITTDSVAKVKKKFGVAGDAYVDIARGQGEIITDGALIACVKDEELLETAQKMLTDVQTNMMPILAQAEAIITSVASILDQVDTGKGVAGAAISDSKLRDDVAAMVAHLEAITLSTENTIGTIDTLMSNEVARVLDNVGTLSEQTVGLMRDEVPLLAGETVKVQGELTDTLAETRRLIEGLQRHWLLRKYVVHEPERLSFVPGGAGAGSGRGAVLLETLEAARAADDPAAIQLAAYNLAVEALATNATAQAADLLAEIRFAERLAGEGPSSRAQLLAAELSRRAGAFEAAGKSVESVLAATRGRDQRALHAEAWLLLVAVYADGGNVSAARTAWRQAERAVERVDDASPVLSAGLSGLNARIFALEGDLAAAANAFATQSERLRDAGLLAGMTTSQQEAADLYASLGMSNSAATYYLRAASGLLARGRAREASELLEKAQLQAACSGDELLTKRIADISRQADAEK